MNYIKTMDELREVYGKDVNHYIKLSIPTVNVLLLLENLDKFKNYTKKQLINLTYYSGYLVINENEQYLSDLEYNMYMSSNKNKKNVLSGGLAIKYLINRIISEDNSQNIQDIIIENIYISTNNQLINYDHVINRNNRIDKLIELSAPDLIIKNEKRRIQELIDEIVINEDFKRKLLF